MSKKDFTGGLNTLLGGQAKEQKPGEAKATSSPKTTARRGRPKKVNKQITKSSQEGTKEGETRATFIVKEDLLEKLKAIAYWDRLLIKDVVNELLEESVERYEKKNGEVKPIPSR